MRIRVQVSLRQRLVKARREEIVSQMCGTVFEGSRNYQIYWSLPVCQDVGDKAAVRGPA